MSFASIPLGLARQRRPRHEPEEDSPEPQDEGFAPSIADVLVVKAMLNKALSLPSELIDSIVDLAEYWPHTSTFVDYRKAPFSVAGGRSRTENRFVIRTPPLGFSKHPASRGEDWTEEPLEPAPLQREHDIETLQRLANSPNPLVEHPCRKIVFTLRSKDQGWGGQTQFHGTFDSSWTWFDAGIERFDASAGEPNLSALRSVWPEVETDEFGKHQFRHEVAPDPAHVVQFNRLVTPKKHTPYRVEWSYRDDVDPQSSAADALKEAGRGKATGDGSFVRSLKVGDVVTLWARARFQAWANHVQEARIDVYWAV